MPEKLDKRLEVRLTKTLLQQAKEKADKQERKLGDVIRDLLRKWLGQK